MVFRTRFHGGFPGRGPKNGRKIQERLRPLKGPEPSHLSRNGAGEAIHSSDSASGPFRKGRRRKVAASDPSATSAPPLYCIFFFSTTWDPTSTAGSFTVTTLAEDTEPLTRIT